MCPIPSCKRYSPHMSKSPHVNKVEADTEVPSPVRHETGTITMDAENAHISQSAAASELHPTLSNEPTPAGSPLLDVCVDKVLHVVMKEIERFDNPTGTARSSGLRLDLESTDSETDTTPTPPQIGTNLTQDISQLGVADLTAAPSSPLVRRSSKRRKNNLEEGGMVMNRSLSGEGWGFLRDLGRVLECDVCASLLYEPVTTPCQHVSSLCPLRD